VICGIRATHPGVRPQGKAPSSTADRGHDYYLENKPESNFSVVESGGGQNGADPPKWLREG
jgi:hypothetical protein